MKTDRGVIRQAAVIVGLLVTLIINTLSVTLPLNGRSTQEISDSFPITFVPAPYVFGIWGPIYVGMIAYAIYQALPANRNDPLLVRIGWPFVLSCIGNSCWIILWHYGFYPWTLLLMAELLVCLVVIYLLLVQGYARARLVERLVIHWPFSMYTAWVTVATIVNTVVVLYNAGWNGWGISPTVWALVLLAVGAALGCLVGFERGDVAFAGVIVWAFIGIGVKQAALPPLVLAANIAAGVVAAVALWGLVRVKRLTAPNQELRTKN